MKGKRFDAIQKCFQEKEIKLRQKINRYDGLLSEVCYVNTQLIKENEVLKKENAVLRAKLGKLLEYAKLSESDLINAIKRDKAIAQISEIIRFMSKEGFI